MGIRHRQTSTTVLVVGALVALGRLRIRLGFRGCGCDRLRRGPARQNSGTLTVCTHFSYKPFEFKDDSGKPVGFDIDLADLTAKKLGVTTTTYVDIEFAQITSGAVFAAKK